jgi:predicted 3-demethylubiquinone-9 3-methyltransferase (glyoxalase superfamily)
MTVLNGWVRDRFGTAWMLEAKALSAFACTALALLILQKINAARVKAR